MTLKDQMEMDVSRVFLNGDEFADKHVVNGENVLCVIDDPASEIRSNRQNEQIPGFSKNARVLYISASAFANMPVYGQLLTIDGEEFFVEACRDEGGMLAIELGANEA